MTTEKTYVRKNNDAIFGEMHVGLYSMSTGIDSVFECMEGVFWVASCVSSMRDCLWYGPALCVQAFLGDGCFRYGSARCNLSTVVSRQKCFTCPLAFSRASEWMTGMCYTRLILIFSA